MKEITVLNNGNVARIYNVDSYEEKYENGVNTLYVIKNGIKTKACNLGDFGYGSWDYSVKEK